MFINLSKSSVKTDRGEAEVLPVPDSSGVLGVDYSFGDGPCASFGFGRRFQREEDKLEDTAVRSHACAHTAL